MLGFCRRHWIGTGLVAMGLVVFGFVRYRMWGPYRSYRVEVAMVSPLESGGASSPFLVGVSRRDVTPDLSSYDPWRDVDGDTHFDPKKGDTWEDRNHNGRFDFVWLAGFDSNRPAQGLNDPLWARAMAVRQGRVTVVLVSIDSIGMTHERFIKVRKSIDHAALGITHIAFSCTHSHNTPDTMGIWSHHPLFSKFDDRYLEFVLQQTRAAVVEAVANLEPSTAFFAVDQMEPRGWVADSRPPRVYDRQLCAVRFVRAGTDETIATLVSWGNHPEAIGGDGTVLSSDFPHDWREGVEQGVSGPGGSPGLGGMCLFFQGPVGGLMTPLHESIPDRAGGKDHTEEGVAKARALGENLAVRTVKLLTGDRVRPMTSTRVGVVARTIFAPIEGTFRIPIALGLIHPGWYGGKAKSEVDAIRIGDLEILTVPGELYPEISDGGVESPTGADYPVAPVEVPSLRSEMRGAVNMVFNLANDEVGYIIPRSQWDTEPPFTYGRKDAPYGEENSGGPGVAEVVHHEGLAVLRQLHALLEASP